MISQETYFALSTPRGRSATATIRINGPHSKNTILKLFKNKNKNLKPGFNHVVSLYNKNNNFVILFGRENEKITKISNKYKDVLVSEKLALFGENNFLQIAINQGAANKLLGLRMHEIIRIEFL